MNMNIHQLSALARRLKDVRLAVIIVVAVVTIVVIVMAVRCGEDTHVGISHTDKIGLSPVQVEQIKDIGQWEFLSISDEELVDTVRHGFFGDDELTRIYYGTLRLGIDLSKVSDGWITMDGDTVNVVLPAVGLLDSSFIDEARTQSFYEDGRWSEADKARLTEKARQAMLKRCLTTSNINSAEQNAAKQFDTMLRGMGFPFTRIRFSKPSETK